MEFELKRRIRLSYDMRSNPEYLARFNARQNLAAKTKEVCNFILPHDPTPDQKKDAMQLCKDWIYALNHWLRCNDRVLCRRTRYENADEPWNETRHMFWFLIGLKCKALQKRATYD